MPVFPLLHITGVFTAMSSVVGILVVLAISSWLNCWTDPLQAPDRPDSWRLDHHAKGGTSGGIATMCSDVLTARWKIWGAKRGPGFLLRPSAFALLEEASLSPHKWSKLNVWQGSIQKHFVIDKQTLGAVGQNSSYVVKCRAWPAPVNFAWARGMQQQCAQMGDGCSTKPWSKHRQQSLKHGQHLSYRLAGNPI